VTRKLKCAINSFFEIAVMFSLVSYVRITGGMLHREDLLHACRLIGLLGVKQWEGLTKMFDTGSACNLGFEERKRQRRDVIDVLLDHEGGGSRW
jgi:hypothetical protein